MGADKPEVTIYSDGSSRGNPGPGGYGTILQYRDGAGTLHEREYSEGFPDTTNNRMEIMGVLRGFKELRKPCRVHVVSDSQYVVNAFSKGWLENWQAHGWRGSDKKTVKNVDLWQELLAVMEPHEADFSWIRGHDGHAENERCDRLATAAADRAGS
ncbi:MAG: ribonuclease HI [Lachnospiraceae bacterium]|nr:ribonuclease HI [Lachnospiraceae bacterium]